MTAPAPRGDAAHWPTDLRLLEDPLDFIREDHMNMRVICGTMEKLSRSPAPDPAEIARLRHFLRHEIQPLIRDEDEELRALLLIRCPVEDEIEPTLERLKAEHDTLGAMCPGLEAVLESLLAGNRPATEGEATLLRDFADRLRRHLIVENAIVLPIARARLTEDDLAQLRRAMTGRRRPDGAE